LVGIRRRGGALGRKGGIFDGGKGDNRGGLGWWGGITSFSLCG